MLKQNIFKVLPVIILSSLLTVSVIFAWKEPTRHPPFGNVDAPINVGETSQKKSGALGIGGVFQAHGGTDKPVLNVVGGNVGIGTENPRATLEVSGQIKITGGSPGENKVLTSDASGLASWQHKKITSGTIIMYSGAWAFDATGLGTGNLSGWALCNGFNGTPNLTDRFVMSSPAAGKTGGANFYYLTIDQLPPHTHAISSDSAHHHLYTSLMYSLTGKDAAVGTVFGSFKLGGTLTLRTSVDYHDHGGKTRATGGGKQIDNRPAYIQLAYIMKL